MTIKQCIKTKGINHKLSGNLYIQMALSMKHSLMLDA